jgi:putative alpha-1,2-mannosidase
MTALGFSGFVGPRDADGFISQNPLSCGGCYWRDYYYQALPWEYSFNAHHDLEKLIELCGGNDMFVKRLEKTFRARCALRKRRIWQYAIQPRQRAEFHDALPLQFCQSPGPGCQA